MPDRYLPRTFRLCLQVNAMNERTLQSLIAISGLSGVGLGAFGAHALKASLTASGMLQSWQTAVHYQLLHTVALLAILVWLKFVAQEGSKSLLNAVGASWMTGIVLFSGSLYGIALGGPRWLGPVTPLGGLGFLAGWLLLFVEGLRRKRSAVES